MWMKKILNMVLVGYTIPKENKKIKLSELDEWLIDDWTKGRKIFT